METMAIDQVLVTIGGVMLSMAIAWYFWFSTREGTTLAVTGGTQEALITVKGGYSPDIIVVEAGKPVRLNFHREETALCSEQVLFPDFNQQATLTAFKTVPIDLMPTQPGEFGFQCGMGMLRGRLIVQEPGGRTARRGVTERTQGKPAK
jgi:plastocyanin domain-containing protein